ncbi:MAG: hypothetical protein A4E38_00501 [Methanoregulaceae archaeon PtaB.Bin108]|nr:MAG: hypothetical protein A4E38_00501 [Methanoregulaceae archaeon PtaB.Bin108]
MRVVADDWFFTRVFDRDILGFGSERNFYIRQDLETIWTEFGGMVRADEYDADGRAVADIRWVLGKGRLIPLTTLRTVIILKRDPTDPVVAKQMDPSEGSEMFSRYGYFNPHLLVRDARKTAIRDRFIGNLLDSAPLFMVNTTGTPSATQEEIRKIIRMEKSG